MATSSAPGTVPDELGTVLGYLPHDLSAGQQAGPGKTKAKSLQR